MQIFELCLYKHIFFVMSKSKDGFLKCPDTKKLIAFIQITIEKVSCIEIYIKIKKNEIEFIYI